MLTNELGMATEKNVSKITPRHYPIYLKRPAIFTLHSASDDDDWKGIIIPSDVEVSVHFLKRFDANLLYNSSSIERKAEILATTERSLSDVICLQNAELTRAYLGKKLSLSNNDSDKPKKGRDPYSLIDKDTRDSVDKVMNSSDLQNAEVILTCEPGREVRIRHFFYNLVIMAKEHRNLKALEVFVGKIAKWNILDEEGSRLIEQEVFQKANKAVLRIFLQNRLDFHIENFGKSAMAALFGNTNMKLGTLKRKKKFNVNAMNRHGYNALHYSMKNKQFKKVKFLLDRGADPNSRTEDFGISPLTLALWEPTLNPTDNAKCAELLLQYGANPFLTTGGYEFGFFRCICAKHGRMHGNVPAVYLPTEYLINLALAYICMYDVDGVREARYRLRRRLKYVDYKIGQDEEMMSFYRRCQHELQTLKQYEIRQNLTMFTIASKTGKYLFQLMKNGDQKIITSLLQKYTRDETIHPYYINAMREHMRQYRKFVALKNRAMLIIAESVKVLATYFIVLNEIVSYLSYEELLMFQ